MTENAARRDLGEISLENVQVTPADGCGLDDHDGIGGFDQLGVGYFIPALLIGSVVDESFHRMIPLFD